MQDIQSWQHFILLRISRSQATSLLQPLAGSVCMGLHVLYISNHTQSLASATVQRRDMQDALKGSSGLLNFKWIGWILTREVHNSRGDLYFQSGVDRAK